MHPVTTACACAAIATLGGIAASHWPEVARLLPLRAAAVLPPTSIAPAAYAPMPVAVNAPGMSGNTVALAPDRYGQFHAEMEVEGRRVPVLVDTGASWVSLSDTTAAELGFFPAPADFTTAMNTANGVARAAPIVIAELRVGPIVARRVRAMVMQHGALTTPTLLGMSFLRGLSGFSVRDGRLVLEQ